MCEPASMILLKDKVLIGKITNSHSAILNQYNIVDDNLKPNFVKIELTPKDRDYKIPLKQWKYKVDQDYLPDWYVAEYDEKRARVALKQWYREHIELQNTDCDRLVQTAGSYSTQTAGYGSIQTVGGHSIQTAGDYSKQTAGDDSNQTAGSDSCQTAGGHSNQTARDYSKQTAGDGSNQTAGYGSIQTAGGHSNQTAGYGSIQTAGDYSTQTAGYGSTQIAGVGTVQIIGFCGEVKTRVITEREANKPYKFYSGDWHLV